MNYLFTCGGTAGHINPAIAVAGKLRQIDPNCGILFVGAKGHMEENLVPREGYDIKTVNITSISRGHNMEAVRHNVDTIKNVVSATKDAKQMIRDFQPDIAIGTGGYVCYPVLRAAKELGIPTMVHESNAVPGLTTKMLANQVDCVMVGFEESKQYYKGKNKIVVTGTPVRGEFDQYTKQQAKKELSLPVDAPLVVSVWGSLGASHMNDVMTDLIAEESSDPGYHLIHATGRSRYKKVIESLEDRNVEYLEKGMDIREYIYDMPRVMAAADLILCRAGASTLAELTYMGKPAILVPSPNVTNNHQEKNARVIEQAGGATVLLEGEFDARSLMETIHELLSDPSRMEEMSKAMRSLAVPDAVDQITSLVLELTGQNTA